MLKIIILFYLLWLFACSDKPSLSNYPDAKPKIVEIESLIEKMKIGYQKHCLQPVLTRDVPEKGCAYRLFEAIDRRFGMNYRDLHVINQGNDFFFEEVERQVMQKLLKKPKLAQQTRNAFPGKKALFAFYRKIYAFKEVP